MARRIRRDLTNKEIRRIVKEQLKENKQDQRSFKKPPKFRILLLFIFVIIIAAAGYYATKEVDFNQFLKFAAADSLAEVNDIKESQEKSSPKIPPKDTTRIKTIKPVTQKFQIEVLNGCGVSGIALKVTDYLRSEGMDVVYMGNYKNFEAKNSQVIARTKDKTNALKIAKSLNIAEKYVTVKSDKNKQLAASVILGKDYKNIKPFKRN